MGKNTGEKLLRVGSRYYREWAARSQTPGFIRCTWCDTEFLVQNATGSKGHEISESHKKWVEKFEKEKKSQGKLAKDKSTIPKAVENQRIVKLFEYKLLNFCLSKNHFTLLS